MKQKLRFINCQKLSFSPRLAQDRMDRAQQSFGIGVVQRILCFSLYLLGVDRRAIGEALDIPVETAKSIIKTLNRNGLLAFADRRRRLSASLPQPSLQPTPITLIAREEYIVVGFGTNDRLLKLHRQNALQVRIVLLSLLNSGLLSKQQVAEAIGLTPAHTATLASRLEREGVSSLIDKREGQKCDYRVTPMVKAELVQQFAIDAIAHGRVSSNRIAAELKDRCNITIPARTVRYHLATMGLPAIKHSLPQLLAAVKRGSSTCSSP